MGTATAQSEPEAAGTRSSLTSVRAAAWVNSSCHPALLFPGNPQFVIYYFQTVIYPWFAAPSTGIEPTTCQGLCAAGRLLSGEGASGRNDPQLPVSSARSHHVGFNAFPLCICSFCLFASHRFNDVSLTGNMGNVCVLVQVLLFFASFSTASNLRKGEFVAFMP